MQGAIASKRSIQTLSLPNCVPDAEEPMNVMDNYSSDKQGSTLYSASNDVLQVSRGNRGPPHYSVVSGKPQDDGGAVACGSSGGAGNSAFIKNRNTMLKDGTETKVLKKGKITNI